MEDSARSALVFRALGDESRLKMVRSLALGDMTPSELSDATGMPSNLIAHHLSVLETSGLVTRRLSEGDRRRRYVMLAVEEVYPYLAPKISASRVLFVCSHNSARSKFAEAALRTRGFVSESAGADPADRVHPKAVQAAREAGLNLDGHPPRSYREVLGDLDLVVSVCDRAREGALPEAREHLHWSVPDPVLTGRVTDFRHAFREISFRVDQLAMAIERGRTT
jgi:protein-tyrosine-phosphatase